MVTALMLSGGVGARLHSGIPKQYIRIGGRMIITYSLEALLRHPMVDEVCIVAESGWYVQVLGELSVLGIPADKITCCAQPGDNRQGSILNGLESVIARKCVEGSAGISPEDMVLIHDAARPVLAAEQISACLGALEGHDGAMPALPVKDTVYMSEDGSRVSSLVDRRKVYAGQAPEAFRMEKYYRANRALRPGEALQKINGSTELAILAGMDVIMFPGDEHNFKITTPEDLERFRDLVRRGMT